MRIVEKDKQARDELEGGREKGCVANEGWNIDWIRGHLVFSAGEDKRGGGQAHEKADFFGIKPNEMHREIPEGVFGSTIVGELSIGRALAG